MSNQAYNIPIIPPDLRKEETIKQIADSLDYLDKVANDVFNRITNQVQSNQEKLRTINDRVNLAQAKIKTIQGSKKATKVFSSSKFPAGEELDEYQSLYKQQTQLTEMKRSRYNLQSRPPPVDERTLKEKLQFYNVHLNLKKTNKEDESQGEGLGRLPRNIPSVSSLLLFNTSENP